MNWAYCALLIYTSGPNRTTANRRAGLKGVASEPKNGNACTHSGRQVLGLCQQEHLQSVRRDGSTDPSAWLMTAGTSTIPGERRIHGHCELKRTSTILVVKRRDGCISPFTNGTNVSHQGRTNESPLLCTFKKFVWHISVSNKNGTNGSITKRDE